jgi:CubicO group peptidase (beta-lactamase class C family)
MQDSVIYDWEAMAAALAQEEPWWEPGSTHGYHVNTFGFLTGEIVRRAAGERIGSFFRREVAQALDADFHFGLAAGDHARVADFLFAREEEQGAEAPQEAEPLDESHRRMLARIYLNPPGLSGIGTVNTPAWRAAEIPSANGHATARAVARIHAALLGGPQRLLGPACVAEATAEASAGKDFVLGRASRFGLGFQLTQPERPLGPNPRSFGHFGYGGAVGFADPDVGLAFGYAMNRSGPRWQNPRNSALIDAVYESL